MSRFEPRSYLQGEGQTEYLLFIIFCFYAGISFELYTIILNNPKVYHDLEPKSSLSSRSNWMFIQFLEHSCDTMYGSFSQLFFKVMYISIVYLKSWSNCFFSCVTTPTSRQVWICKWQAALFFPEEKNNLFVLQEI